jgi:hypothetical protein
MKTTLLLMAQYDSKPVISVEVVCRDFFQHLTPEKFVRKCSLGEINIPVIRMEASQKCTKAIHLEDLATYLDSRRAAAIKEAAQLQA